jgi:hypothetical protein
VRGLWAEMSAMGMNLSWAQAPGGTDHRAAAQGLRSEDKWSR